MNWKTSNQPLRLIISLLMICALFMMAVGAAGASPNPTQSATILPATTTLAQGAPITFTVQYDTSDNNNALTAFAVTVHFNGDVLDYLGYDSFYATGKLAFPVLEDDSTNSDSNAATTKLVRLAWSDPFGGAWPGTTLPLDLVKLRFQAKADAATGSTPITPIVYTGANGYDRVANGATVTIVEPPKVTNVTSSVADGSYKAGDVIPIQVVFDQAVNVTGTPVFTLVTSPIGTTMFGYVSGTGTDTLVFNYTVAAGDSSADLDYQNTTSLSLNNGTPTITGANDAALDAVLTLPAPSAAGSLSANKDIVIDTTAPVVAFTAPTAITYQNTAAFTFTGTADSDSGSVIDKVQVSLNGGAFTDVAVPSRKASVTWSYAATLAAGSNTLVARALDGAGNVSAEVASAAVIQDLTAPTAAITFSPVINANGKDWAKAGVITTTVVFSDNYGIDATKTLTMDFTRNTKVDPCSSAFTGDWTDATTWQGTTTLGASCDGEQNGDITGAQDLAGNVITPTYTFWVDSVDPTLAISTTLNNTVGTAFTLTGTASDSASGVASVQVSPDGGTTWNAAAYNAGDWSYNATLAAGPNTLTVRVTDNAGNYTEDTHSVFSGNQLALSVGGVDVTGGTVYVPSVNGANTVDVTVTGGTANYGTYSWSMDPISPTEVMTTTVTQTMTITATVGMTGTQTLTVTDPVDGGVVFFANTTIETVQFALTGPENGVVGNIGTYNTVGAVGNVTWAVLQGGTLVSTPPASGASADFTYLGPGTVEIQATDSATGVSSSVTTTLMNQLTLSVGGQDVTGGVVYVPSIDGSNTVDVTVTGGTLAYGTYGWSLDPITPTQIMTAPIAQIVTISATVGMTGTQTLTVQDPLEGGLILSATTTIETTHFTLTGSEIGTVGDTFTYFTLGAVGTVTWDVPVGAALVSAAPASGAFANFTLLAAGPATIRATDSTTGFQASVNVNILNPVTVTNKPATTPTVKAGTPSAIYTAAGGDGVGFTWTVTRTGGYSFVRTGASFVFVPPTTGAFAGTYTVTVTDAGDNSVDTFQIFVPIKLVMAEYKTLKVPGSNNLKAVPPVADVGDSVYLWAQGLEDSADLNVVYVQNPVEKDVVVLEEVISSTMSFFQVDALAAGSCVVGVTDATGTFTDSLRVDVIGFSDVTGTVTNKQPEVAMTDLEVNLRNYATHEFVDDSAVTDGAFTITDVPHGTYLISLEGAGAGYVPFKVQKMITVNGDTVWNPVVPEVTPITGTYSLDVTFDGDYTGNTIDYTLTNAETGAIVQEGMHPAPGKPIDDDLLLTGISEGDYTFAIQGGGYVPQVYTNPGSDVVSITENTAITMTLMNEDPSVVVYHQETPGGITIYAITTGNGWPGRTFDASCDFTASTGSTTVDISGAMSGSGEEDNPYTYAWTPGDTLIPAVPATNAAGDSVYTLDFEFDGTPTATSLPVIYPVTYTVYASEENRDDDLDDDQKEMEAVNGKALYVTLGEKEFLPATGTTFLVNLPDADGTIYPTPVTIPPIPVSMLFVDDFDTAGAGADTLLYGDTIANKGNDYYGEDKATATPLAADEIIKAKVIFYTFGEDALGTGVSMKFVLASDGVTPVRYNPILLDGNKRQRVVGAPAIILPILLNKDSSFYTAFKKLSDAGKKLGIMVSERGDGKATFHYETLDFTVTDAGLMLLDLPHLTLVTPAKAAAAGNGDTVDDGDESDCFVDSVSRSNGFAGLAVVLAALLAALAVRTRKNAA
ncbi:MAG: hypothetical protein JEZ02_02895 [Desulfatibacillum sp.]|nr:hypothetical protein [Desulfatibacillum sp.]